MDWCRLDTTYYLDGAILRAGEAAELLFLRCIAYSGAQETGGRVPQHVLPMLAPTKTKIRLDALVRENLLLLDGHDVLIRSWSRHQERLDVESERRRKDRERKAAERLAARTAAGQSEDTSTEVPRTVPTESTRKEVEEEVQEKRPNPPKPSASPPKAKRTRIPDEFPATDELRSWLAQKCPSVNGQAETAQWLDYHRAKGDTAVDWVASWRTWMRNAQKFWDSRGGRSSGKTAEQDEQLRSMMARAQAAEATEPPPLRLAGGTA